MRENLARNDDQHPKLLLQVVMQPKTDARTVNGVYAGPYGHTKVASVTTLAFECTVTVSLVQYGRDQRIDSLF